MKIVLSYICQIEPILVRRYTKCRVNFLHLKYVLVNKL